jgi:hypothetical protein
MRGEVSEAADVGPDFGALQVMWGLSAAGPFTNTVTGYSRAYIQARAQAVLN